MPEKLSTEVAEQIDLFHEVAKAHQPREANSLSKNMDQIWFTLPHTMHSHHYVEEMILDTSQNEHPVRRYVGPIHQPLPQRSVSWAAMQLEAALFELSNKSSYVTPAAVTFEDMHSAWSGPTQPQSTYQSTNIRPPFPPRAPSVIDAVGIDMPQAPSHSTCAFNRFNINTQITNAPSMGSLERARGIPTPQGTWPPRAPSPHELPLPEFIGYNSIPESQSSFKRYGPCASRVESHFATTQCMPEHQLHGKLHELDPWASSSRASWPSRLT